MTLNDPYAALSERFRRLSALSDALAMLGWDKQAIMPSGGAAARSEQMATLSVMRHEMLTSPEVQDWIDAADTQDPTGWQGANLREMRRTHAHATALPGDLVDHFSRASSTCEQAWRQARADDDFKVARVHLANLIQMVREIADRKAERLGKSTYDALLDQFEPDGKSARIDQIFSELAIELPPLLEAVLERQADWPQGELPAGPHPTADQKALGERVMAQIGFNFDHGRLDTSAHPFCGGVPDDVRITTRYDENDFTSALMGVIHETGHSLYERGLPGEWRGQPVGDARGMVLHESQSLLMEMQACRSPEFLRYLTPLLAGALGGDGWRHDALQRTSHRVTRGLIRVEADEVTYPLHVMLRYKLEKVLLSGDLAVADLPGAWNDGMASMIGSVPASDHDGCLQDIHWYDGAVGYFPTYTLGALAAAQLFQTAKRAMPTLMDDLAVGDFSPLVAWLGKNVHRWGSFHDTDALLVEATGAPLSAAPFLAHLKARYLPDS